MKKIERPIWLYINKDKHSIQQVLDNWFDTHLKDHYAVHKNDLIRVYAKSQYPLDKLDFWSGDFEGTHQAYLIKSSIEPIKQETAEDILRDLYEAIDHGAIKTVDDVWQFLRKRNAKAALSREEREG
jgi:hypothetical protein